MTISADDVIRKLESIANDDFFSASADKLIRKWVADGATVNIVEPILRFFEAHPDVDHGIPGSLIHYIESFAGKGYEERLLASLKRRPTPPTVWLLNRWINAARSDPERRHLRSLLAQSMNHPLADDATRQIIVHLEEYQDRRDLDQST